MVVRASQTILVASVVVATAGVLLLSVVGPTVVDGDGEDSAAMFIKAALWAYKDQNGHVPRDFVEVLPFLERIARTECSIDRLQGDRYRVQLCARQRMYDIDVQYVGDPATNKEESWNSQTLKMSSSSLSPGKKTPSKPTAA